MKQYTIYAGSVGIPKGNAGSLSGHGEGIYTLHFDGRTLTKTDVTPSVYAGIITLSKDHQYLYAANEAKDFGGRNGSGGGLSAYRINEDNTLTKLNDSISYGSRTSYITVSDDQQYILVTNHGSHTTITCHYIQDESGNWISDPGFDDSGIAVFKRNNDGSIGELTDLKIFHSKGYWCHGGGQSTSHLHCIKERNGLVFGMNRGGDEIEVLRLDSQSGKLQLLNQYKTRYGYAPRHMEFHPVLPLLYVVQENYPAISVYRYDESGNIEEIQFLPTMPNNYYDNHPLPSFQKPHANSDEYNTSGMNDASAVMPSDIHVTRDGQYLFVSNRQRDGIGSITSYRLNQDGFVEMIETTMLSARDPRGFAIIDDTYLIVGNCDKDQAVIYRINNGKLEQIVCDVQINSPASFQIK